MSSINVDTIKSRLGGPPTLSKGVVVSAAATFSGDVSIGGTITYEDVTNVDSVGLITARSGIEFGASGVGGTVTSVGNATFAGIVTASSFVGNLTGTASDATAAAAGLSVSGGNLTVGSGVTIGPAGVATFSGTSDVHLLDNVRLNVGDGSDFRISHTGSHTELDSYTGNLSIRNLGSTGDIYIDAKSGERGIKIIQDGAVEAYYANSKKFETTTSGTITTGVSTVTSTIYVNTNGSSIAENNLNFASSGKAYIDHKTTSQDIDFRVSHGSALDRTAITIGSAGITTFYDTPHDGKGSLRNIPARVESTGVTLTAADAGKVVATSTGNFIIPAGVFTTQGMTVTLLNRSNSTQTINATALTTLYNTADGANVKDSTLTLGIRTMATIWFDDASTAYIQAASLTVS